MILVTVGTQFFDPLIVEVDRLAGAGILQGDVLAQIGLSRFEPKHVRHVRFDRSLPDLIRQAELIITHAGTGTVIEVIESGRPFVAVVNGEKAGDHQREFLEALETTHDFCWIDSPGKLEQALPKARRATAHRPGSAARLAASICDEIDRAAQTSKRQKIKTSKTSISADLGVSR